MIHARKAEIQFGPIIAGIGEFYLSLFEEGLSDLVTYGSINGFTLPIEKEAMNTLMMYDTCFLDDSDECAARSYSFIGFKGFMSTITYYNNQLLSPMVTSESKAEALYTLVEMETEIRTAFEKLKILCGMATVDEQHSIREYLLIIIIGILVLTTLLFLTVFTLVSLKTQENISYNALSLLPPSSVDDLAIIVDLH
eukprot:gnl/Carplike_NY0171/5732_a7859_302.p1 GENE.gnl/Carplike_NY0171/5732_a7859_302~~gnl/Carplike_NY0171/5732_a7859_302.p1  ORF type:complete len:218 (+),score=25.64 gnl/Carplike_NY0171/5732_a7859_302:69-656(+)